MSRIRLQGWSCRRTSQPNELISIELAINIMSLIMNWFIARIPENTRNNVTFLPLKQVRVVVSSVCSLIVLAEFIMGNVALSWTEIKRQWFIAVMPPATVKAKILKTDHSCHR